MRKGSIFASQRKDKPFVAINCAALPETLLESNLFGHEKRAFSGAIRSTKGLFLQADEGTIFLDEIGDMPLSIQAKVLRVLQDKQFYPVGSEKLVEVNVRIIVATNKNLEEQVEQGFSERSLLQNPCYPHSFATLRDRKEDIPPLVDHFLNKFRNKVKKDIKGIYPSSHAETDAPRLIRERSRAGKRQLNHAAAMTDTELIDENLIFQTKVIPSITYIKPLKEAKDVFERGYLIYLLETCKGKVSIFAKLAGKYRADFYLLLKKHDLNPDDFKNKG